MLPVGQVTRTRAGLGFAESRRIVLSNAEIQNLPATTVVLVPEQPGLWILPLWFTIDFDPNLADYTNNNGTDAFVDFPSGALFNDDFGQTNLDSILAPNFQLGLTGPVTGWFSAFFYEAFGEDVIFPNGDVYNQPLGLSVSNDGTSDPYTGGDPANKWTLTLYYFLIP
jgi:hypothetical protein